MQFKTQSERENYFGAAYLNPDMVAFGSALEHAATTNLGIWGDERALAADCAKILGFEIRRYIDGRRSHSMPVRDAAILSSNAFRTAFAAARRNTDAAIAEALESLSGERHTLRHSNHTATEPVTGEALARIVFEEIY